MEFNFLWHAVEGAQLWHSLQCQSSVTWSEYLIIEIFKPRIFPSFRETWMSVSVTSLSWRRASSLMTEFCGVSFDSPREFVLVLTFYLSDDEPSSSRGQGRRQYVLRRQHTWGWYYHLEMEGKIVKRVRESTLPRGTPQRRGKLSSTTVLSLILSLLSSRKSHRSFFRTTGRLRCKRRSKACVSNFIKRFFDIFPQENVTLSGRGNSFTIASAAGARAWWVVPQPERKPNCNGLWRLWNSRNLRTLELMGLSNNFPGTSNKEMGR